MQHGHYFYYNDPGGATSGEFDKAEVIFTCFAEHPLFRRLVFDLPNDADNWSGFQGIDNSVTGRRGLSLNGYTQHTDNQTFFPVIDLGNESLTFMEKGSTSLSDDGFVCVKTANKPYDMVVVCIIKALLTYGLVRKAGTDVGAFNFYDDITIVASHLCGSAIESQWRQAGVPKPAVDQVVNAYNECINRNRCVKVFLDKRSAGHSKLASVRWINLASQIGGRSYYF